MYKLAVLASLLGFITSSEAFFDQFFNQQHQQHQQQAQQRPSHDHEAVFMTTECDRFLCQDTLQCVDTPVDCPCPFPNSQVKCVYPDNDGYVCLSKGDRDCDWVSKAYNGLV